MSKPFHSWSIIVCFVLWNNFVFCLVISSPAPRIVIWRKEILWGDDNAAVIIWVIYLKLGRIISFPFPLSLLPALFLAWYGMLLSNGFFVCLCPIFQNFFCTCSNKNNLLSLHFWLREFPCEVFHLFRRMCILSLPASPLGPSDSSGFNFCLS